MMDRFPPESSRTQEIGVVLAAFGSVLTDRTAIYVSAPLTTGHRFSVWRSRRNSEFDESHPEYQAEHSREVVEPNRREVERLVAKLRQRHSIVIDPGGLPDIAGWTQSDYRILWKSVIERYVTTVVFANGWEYSSGCAYEYLTALSSGAQALNSSERPIEPSHAYDMIARATREIEGHGTSSNFLRGVLRELKTFS